MAKRTITYGAAWRKKKDLEGQTLSEFIKLILSQFPLFFAFFE
jgi:hypothetical protein